MDMGMAVSILRTGIYYILTLSAPLLLIGMGVGLIISIFQATTSIQEQTLTFVPKIAAIMIALMFFGPWIISSLVNFTEALFSQIPDVAR